MKLPFRKFLTGTQGQVLPIVALMLITLLGFAALVLDLGHAYYCHRELQQATDAAALAGAGSLLGVAPQTTATAYSAVSGAYNAHSNLQNVSMVSGYPQLRCLTTLQSQGLACTAPNNANAVTVVQQAKVPMFFAGLFGKPTLTISASATAAMRGAGTTPYNVMIVLDSTASMKQKDKDSNCNSTREDCAQSGMRVLLQSLTPCATNQTSCGTATNGNVANAVDKVALMTFPGLQTTADAQAELGCSGPPPKVASYTYPTLPVYSVVDWSSDYRSSPTAGALNTSSNLVTVSGGVTSCKGIQPIGGAGTYYAGVIYAAQSALQAASAPGVQNVMIILSDGDASATPASLPGASPTSGVYPSVKNQCAQAITAAKTATAAGTRVYAVAYGATAAGCSTDTPTITPCQTMQQMASAPQYFYSDYTASAGNGACVSASQPVSGLNQIFMQIAGDMTLPRLIPDNTP